jgi:hypothetical protein
MVAMFAVQHTSSPSSIMGAVIGLEAFSRPLDTTTTSNPTFNEHHESQWRNGHMPLQEMEEKPWKYIGYKGYFRFIASNPDLFILKMFAPESTRLALWLQYHVSEASEGLERIDMRHSQRDVEDIHNGSFRDDPGDRRRVLETLLAAISRYKLVDKSRVSRIG